MGRKIKYGEVNGKSFLVMKLDGKAPFKVCHIKADGSESYRTHHKTMELALAKCAYYHPDYPVKHA